MILLPGETVTMRTRKKRLGVQYFPNSLDVALEFGEAVESCVDYIRAEYQKAVLPF